MTGVLQALGRAGRSITHPKMLGLLLIPFVVAVIFWILTAWLVWDPLMGWITARLGDGSGWIAGSWQWLVKVNADWVLPALVLVLLVVPMMFASALVLIGVFATPVVLAFLSGHGYPDVERRANAFNAGGIARSLGNALWSLALFVVGYLLTMPLWLIPPLIVVVPWFWWTWLTARLMRLDSLADHADDAERRRMITTYRRDYFLLGGAVSLLNYLPPLFIVAPIFAALAFCHFSLQRLRELRAAQALGLGPALDALAGPASVGDNRHRPDGGRPSDHPAGSPPFDSNAAGLPPPGGTR